ncbi:MAG: hypothetical protein JXR70_08995 [Spirochaetales bacterium]|nr:hypothetical protein [Spirochaetales bacterium]
MLLQSGVNAGTNVLNDAAQVLLALLPIISVVVIGVLTIIVVILDHKQRMVIFEKSGNLPPRKINEKILLIGLLSTFIGITLTVFFAIKDGFSDTLLGGILPAATGLGIICYILIITLNKREEDGKAKR